MNRALDYIEENLDKDIDLNYAAKTAFCNKSTLSNAFYMFTNIPLNEYIRRRKMSLSALELQNNDIKILDLALKYGYNSPTAFNRAFKNQHGISPQYARSRNISLKTYPRITFQIKLKGDIEMNCRIEQKPAFTVAGISKVFRNDMEGDSHIPDFWRTTSQETYEKICEIGNAEPKGLLGLCANFCGHEFDYFIAAATTKPIPDDLQELKIPAATWAIFESAGQIHELVGRIFSEWLPSSKYNRADERYPDIEVYYEGSIKTADFKYEIWIPIIEK